MTDDKLREYLKRATTELHLTRQRLDRLTAQGHEPIAIIGMGCRYPGGVRSPEELWDLVASGTDAVSTFPDDRGWDLEGLHDPQQSRPDTTYSNQGGFIAGVADFDPAFFGISPREALAMDPQQRLLLETVWESFERAGIDPATARGSATGVFAGVQYQDYSARLRTVPDDVRGYLGNGGSGAIASGRVSFLFGLQGPAVTVDTACSSSLVALHLAAHALRRGECSLALAGGSMVMSTPIAFLEMSRQNGLARDGRSKSFSDSADGTGWGEGVGMLLLEKVSDAERHGHPILALVRGTAVNQDGASGRLTAPNGPAQQRVIRQAVADAGLRTGDVDVVEAHGTGTPLGDPIEAQALIATYGRGRAADRPLLLGSLKSNIGHTQAAAGVGGVIKMVMAIRHGVVPPSLHADVPSTQVDWSGGTVRLVSQATPWPVTDHPRRAAVSSFGVSGTNSHVVLEAAPAPGPGLGRDGGPDVPERAGIAVPWVLSGRGPAALRAQAAQLRAFLDHSSTGEPRPEDIGYALAAGRAVLEDRAVLIGSGRAGLGAGLDRLMGADLLESNCQGDGFTLITGSGRRPSDVVFVFPGQGSQWLGMGRDLLASSPVFAARMAECAQALAPHLDYELLDVIAGTVGAPGLERDDVVQPVLFAVMVSLAEVWRAAGVIPAAVLGHSQGEIAAACVAGALTLADAAAVVALRARALRALAGQGSMTAVALAPDAVTAMIAPWAGRLTVAVVNGPTSVAVSGDVAALAEFGQVLARQGVRHQAIGTDYAPHGPQVAAIESELTAVLAGIRPVPAETPFYSSTVGGLLQQPLDAGYWYRNMRERVQFEQATRAVLADGFTVLLEVSPHPVLRVGIEETIEATGTPAAVRGCLRRDDGGRTRFLTSLAELHVLGVPVDWAGRLSELRPRPIDLPTYPFQRRRYWLEDSGPDPDSVLSAGLAATGHPLLGAVIALADDAGVLFTGRLSVRSQPWLGEHVVQGRIVVPGTAFLELAVKAGDEVGCDRVEELVLQAPLVLPEHGGVALRVTVGAPDPAGSRPFSLHSRSDEADAVEARVPWTRHATGRLGRAAVDAAAGGPDLSLWPPPGAEEIPLEGLYEAFAAGGFAYGPLFQGLRHAWRQGETLFAEAALPADAVGEGARFGLHPALLDAALHVTALSGPDGGRMPFSWNGVQLHARGASQVRLALSPAGAGSDTVAVTVADPAGAAVLSVAGFTLRPVTAPVPVPAGRTPALYRLDWSPWPARGGLESPAVNAVLAAGPTPFDRLGARHPDLAGLRVALDQGAARPETVLVAPAPDPGEDPAAIADALEQTLRLVQDWLADERFSGSRLVLLTRSAVVTTGAEATCDLAARAQWGLVRSAQNEHPGRFVLLDLDDETSPAQILAAVSTGEPQVALRAGVPLVPRLAAVTVTGDERFPDLDPEGTVLITGGTGLLGSLLARHLVSEHGVRRLLLLSRSGAGTPEAAALVAELTGLGAAVRVAAVDVAERASLAAALAAVPADHPLTAVMHTAGVLDDGVISSLTPSRLRAVLRPKVDGALHLHQLTGHLPLAAFVVFSSATGTFGGPGQANYAAANAVLDGLAEHRRARGLPSHSLAWTLWEERSGLTGHLADDDLRRLARSGMPALSTEQGLALFDAALGVDTPTLVPIRLDLSALRARAGTEAPSVLLSGLVPSAGRPVAAATGEAGTLAARLRGLPPGDAERMVADLVRTHVAAALGYASGTALPVDRPFQDLGFDSLAAVDLRNRLNAVTGLRLPASLVFDYPTPLLLGAYLRAQLTPAAAEVVSAPRRPADPAGAADDPIVIVSMACRFPGGVTSPEDLWRLVESGTDAIEGFPRDRGWEVDDRYDPDAPAGTRGVIYNREGGFLHDVSGFDATFFGISPREALAMDPQQRVMLETAWEVLERAGIDPATLKGSRTGVFAGLMSQDYAIRLLPNLPEEVAGFLGAGNSGSVLSGRVSYTFGFEGPSLTVDTACSSSLVAVHLAAQALRAGECDLALAGGVTVMSSPELFVEFSRQGGVARDGRCKSYAQAADGTGFGEGVGLVAVQRLSQARAAGRPVLAVLSGSAVNQDGASNGLTAPNGPSQQRVIRAALADAGLSPADVDAVEGHGTGTTLGDPIEAQALIAVYGPGRDPRFPLWLGSVKSNIGHTSAAAGIGGLIKTVQALRHAVLPPTLHVDEPSRQVDWTAGAVRLLTERRPWPERARPRRAGVSSFGMSGTNVHVVLEQAPAEPVLPVVAGAEPSPLSPATAGDVLPWLLSARTDQALREQAGRLIAGTAGSDLLDVAHSLIHGRARQPVRAVLLGSDRAALARGAGALGAGEPDAGVIRGQVPDVPGRTVFVFPGQGSQWIGMGRELIVESPVFAAAMRRCEQALNPFVDWSLSEVLDDPAALARVDVVQPALFAVMVSLAEVWRSMGVVPDAVVGHSQGEIAAAVVAGALSLEAGARVVALRSRALIILADQGAMISVALDAGTLQTVLERWNGQLSLAVLNGPSSSVVSGRLDALAELLTWCESEQIRTRWIDVDYASHSAQVETIREALAVNLTGLDAVAATVPMFSTTTAAWIDGSALDADYWFANLRDQVRFAPAIAALAQEGFTRFVEVSAHPVLTTAIEQTLEPVRPDALIQETLRRDDGGRERLLRSAGQLWAGGVEVDWAALVPGGRAVDLPTYPWQHTRFWLEADPGTAGRDVASVGMVASGHPLLGAAVELADSGEMLLSGRVSLGAQPWLADHRVSGVALFPGTAFLDLVLRAGLEVGCGTVEELTLSAPLALPEDGGVSVQVRVGASEIDVRAGAGFAPGSAGGAGGTDGAGGRVVSVHSRSESTGQWTAHATGRLSQAPVRLPEDLLRWPPTGAEPVDVSRLYERFAEGGYDYGSAFQGVRAAWRHQDDVYADVALPETVSTTGFGMHPALLDAALHASALSGVPVARLPFSWTGVASAPAPTPASRLRIRVRPEGDSAVSVLACDSTGVPVLAVAALQLRPLTAGSASGTGPLRVTWIPLEPDAAEPGTAEPDAAEPDAAEPPSPAGAGAVPLLADWAIVGGALPGLPDLTRRADLSPPAGAEPVPGTLLLISGPEALDPESPAGQYGEVLAVLALVQDWLGTDAWAGTRLVVVTRGGVATGPSERVNPSTAAVWGLIRSAQAEEPGRFALVDLDLDPASAAALPGALAVAGPDAQIALRAGLALTPRLRPTPRPGELMVPVDGSSWRVGLTSGGTMDDLVAVPAAAAGAELGGTQVRIAVRAAGINFHDVVETLGLITDGDGRFGGEGAGVVLEVGAQVGDLRVGDRVLGVFGEAFGPVAVAERAMLAPVPAGWTFAQAAAVPISSLTAYYGLFDLAGLRAGERVLIHAATGGVGTAAVQLARQAGAEVYATASPAKWPGLRSMGLDQAHIASSRDLEFEPAFLAATAGAGMDVVLDCLAGEFVDASLRLLPRGGRFVELGRTDVRDPEQVAATCPGVRYRAFDLIEAGPERTATMLTEVLARITAGALTLPPITGWDVREVSEAFRTMSQARHIGKNVLTLPAAPDPDGTVIITGGAGTIGSALARHLVTEHGVRHLILAGRRGAGTPGGAELVTALAELGAETRLVRCDVTDPGAVEGLVASVPPAHPLTGVVHAAGVLEDGMITALSAGSMRRVLDVKIGSAWHLHRATRGADLSMFVLISSGAGLFGAAGQGNYAAANAALDALAALRRSEGLAGLSIGWGLWADTSVLTGGMSEAARERLSRSGMRALGTEQALALFDAALAGSPAYVLAADLGRLGTRARGTVPPLLRSLLTPVRRPAGTRGGPAPVNDALMRQLSLLPEEDAYRTLLDLVLGQAEAVLGHGPSGQLRPQRPFKEFGFDSLTGVELRNRLSTATGLRLPAAMVFDHPTPEALARHLTTRTRVTVRAGDPLADILRLESSLTGRLADEVLDGQIAARLRQILDRLRPAGAPGRIEDLNEATNDDLFDLIDNGYRSS